ncbi:MAG: glycosyltransferase [Bacteroidetes bacterium]|nr:glycosyltransferase [Bacteroidota bacterium]
MQLSVIIVNYNVQYFLEQCLHSVLRACKNIESEIFVVDNNSVDESVQMVREKFPQVKLIANKENTGFSKANNQAIKESKGKYVLLLNPDTVVEEDTFSKTIQFMNEHPDAGALGVKMIDGKGNFLPESKRGLPTPSVAFYKIFGLSKLFPRSKKFGRYHLGFLDTDKINEVEILAGAFMLMRKETLDKVGLLDETFFMYGEDIDLSYRIILGGYKNYYYPETRIIHYKGESTKKSSINYVFVFYNAMIIFAKKHFSSDNAKLFSLLINLAIYFRAGIAILTRVVKQSILPLIDAAILFAGVFGIKKYYETSFKYSQGGEYPLIFTTYIIPLFIVLWLVSMLFSGSYDKPYNWRKVLKGSIAGCFLILATYSLFPESLRFSRAILLMSFAWSLFSLVAVRYLFTLMGVKSLSFPSNIKRLAIVGSREECNRVVDLISNTSIKPDTTLFVSVDKREENPDHFYKGSITQLKEIVKIYKIDELVFCARDMSAQSIINTMSELPANSVEYKIAPPESLSVIGSSSIDTAGDIYTIEIDTITKPHNKRNKRLFDVLSSLVLIIALPLIIWIVKSKAKFLKNIFWVLLGTKSWVGYIPSNTDALPKIKQGVISPLVLINANQEVTAKIKNEFNLSYAKNFSTFSDFQIILKGIRELGL